MGVGGLTSTTRTFNHLLFTMVPITLNITNKKGLVDRLMEEYTVTKMMDDGGSELVKEYLQEELVLDKAHTGQEAMCSVALSLKIGHSYGKRRWPS